MFVDVECIYRHRSLRGDSKQSSRSIIIKKSVKAATTRQAVALPTPKNQMGAKQKTHRLSCLPSPRPGVGGAATVAAAVVALAG